MAKATLEIVLVDEDDLRADCPKVGQVGRLKSGGPPMTVSKVNGNRVECLWFDESNSLQEASFYSCCLLHDASYDKKE